MAQAVRAREPGFDPDGMRQFLPHAVAASLGVLGFPSAVLFSMLILTEPNPPVLLCSLLSLTLSSLASVIGARLWQKHPRSKDVSFGDLMFWSWWGRKRAEGRLARGTAALGLDRRGTPVGHLTLTRAEQLRVLRELNEALESKDPYTRGHSKRVERHVFRMANAMGLSVHEIEELRLAAALHDVGKIRIPDHILRKPGELTTAEFDLMKEHPSVGAWMLSFVGSQDVIEAVRYHHERWDGRGYPDGVTGTDIPLFARMISVADTYDAITSTRPYRAKSARERAVAELRAAAGSQLDPMCVDIFCRSLPVSVPITAALYLLPAGIKRLVRELAVTSRRAGLQAIASGVSAASAAVIVTTPVVAPALGGTSATPERTRGAVVTSDAGQGLTGDARAADGNEDTDGTERTGLELGDDPRSGKPIKGRAGRAFAGLDGDPLTGLAVPLTAEEGTDPSLGTTGDGTEGTEDPGTGGDSDPTGIDDGSQDQGLAGDNDGDRSDDAGPGNSGNGNGNSNNGQGGDKGGPGKGSSGGNGNAAPGNGNAGNGNAGNGNPGGKGNGNGSDSGDGSDPEGDADDGAPAGGGNGNGDPGGNGNGDPGGNGPPVDPGGNGGGKGGRDESGAEDSSGKGDGGKSSEASE